MGLEEIMGGGGWGVGCGCVHQYRFSKGVQLEAKMDKLRAQQIQRPHYGGQSREERVWE